MMRVWILAAVATTMLPGEPLTIRVASEGWGDAGTADIEKVLAEWDRIHRPIARAIRAVEKAPLNPDQKRALWRNHRHLRNHIKVIERLLRKLN